MIATIAAFVVYVGLVEAIVAQRRGPEWVSSVTNDIRGAPGLQPRRSSYPPSAGRRPASVVQRGLGPKGD